VQYGPAHDLRYEETMKTGIPAGSYLLLVVACAMTFGCGSTEPQNGALLCGKEPHPCPDGFVCSMTTGTCWKRGTEPIVDGGGNLAIDALVPVDVAPAVDLAVPLDTSIDVSAVIDTAVPRDLAVDLPQGQDAVLVAPVDAPIDTVVQAGLDVALDVPADATSDIPLAPDAPPDNPPGNCTIGVAAYPSNAGNPGNVCQYCNPSLSATGWSNQADGLACGAGAGQYCSAGVCSSGCLISGSFYPSNATNPADTCQTCLTTSPTAWTRLTTGACSVQVCDAGVCVSGCMIGGRFVATGTVNATNICQACNPSKSTTDWSNNDAATAIECGSCGGTAACTDGVLGPCSVDAYDYYPDNDGDGYGAPSGAVKSCAKPAGYASNGKDCCDGDPSVHPGQSGYFASANACGNFDYNCDGAESLKPGGTPGGCPPIECAIVNGACTQTNTGCTSYLTVAACGQPLGYVSSFCVGYSCGPTNCCQAMGSGNGAGNQACN
jgi:hypothetical protein